MTQWNKNGMTLQKRIQHSFIRHSLSILGRKIQAADLISGRIQKPPQIVSRYYQGTGVDERVKLEGLLHSKDLIKNYFDRMPRVPDKRQNGYGSRINTQIPLKPSR
jgi:hypothetical protein